MYTITHPAQEMILFLFLIWSQQHIFSKLGQGQQNTWYVADCSKNKKQAKMGRGLSLCQTRDSVFINIFHNIPSNLGPGL